MPYLQQDHEANHRSQRGQNVGQLRAHVIRNHKLRSGKQYATKGCGGNHCPQRAPAAHHHHKVGGNNQGNRSADPAHSGAQQVARQGRYRSQHVDRSRNRAEGNGCGIGQQANSGREERRKSQAGQHGGGHGDGCAKPRRALNERTERKRNQQSLQAAVAREIADRILDHLKLPCLHGDVVKQDRGEHNPPDGKPSLHRAISNGRGHQWYRHPVNKQGDGHGADQSHKRRNPRRLAHDSQHDQQYEDWCRRNQGG